MYVHIIKFIISSSKMSFRSITGERWMEGGGGGGFGGDSGRNKYLGQRLNKLLSTSFQFSVCICEICIGLIFEQPTNFFAYFECMHIAYTACPLIFAWSRLLEGLEVNNFFLSLMLFRVSLDLRHVLYSSPHSLPAVSQVEKINTSLAVGSINSSPSVFLFLIT